MRPFPQGSKTRMQFPRWSSFFFTKGQSNEKRSNVNEEAIRFKPKLSNAKAGWRIGNAKMAADLELPNNPYPKNAP